MNFYPYSYKPEKFAKILKEWTKDPSSHPEIEDWYKNGAKPIPKEETQEEKDFKIYYKIYEEAYNLEKSGEIDKALEKYLYILDNFIPTGYLYYERPAIILEKKHDYQKAIEICNKALSNKHFNKPTKEYVDEAFSKRLNRLIKKINK
ncbi:hypothetical protein PQV03_09865 [Thermoanaerobacterium thermosaccharolyticum]|uniref:hypothetical protein n=1 Tax=Thermoanaerobacterium thermosaccharolyticum TaxID=1517 RepID=UPI003D272962